jgi:hypothetical protein
MHLVDPLVISTIFDDVVIPKIEPRDCREERSGNFGKRVEVAPIGDYGADPEDRRRNDVYGRRHEGRNSQCHDFRTNGAARVIRIARKGANKLERRIVLPYPWSLPRASI